MMDMNDVICESGITKQVKEQPTRECRHGCDRTDKEKGTGILNDDRVCCKAQILREARAR